ncbi:PAS domain S-box protein [Clostridium sp. ATCC 25772]|uniref:sensor histidine kinase n=1 Tax=Clostridium sp. ATCC 25772 TaxID=1676991 RepID=UPI0007830FEC|nr:PAS domain S-box protein [Clostridium sp. ATCC 25772]
MNLIYNTLDEGILIIDKYGKINFGNKSLLKRLGYDEIEIKSLKLQEIICKDEKKILDIIKNKENVNDLDIELYCKSKSILFFRSKIILDKWKGEDCKVLVLKEKGKRPYIMEDLEYLLDTIPYGAWMKNVDGVYIYANDAYASRFGRTRYEILGEFDKDFWGEELSIGFRRDDNEVVKSKTPKLLEEKVKHNGYDQWLETYKAPIFDEEGNVKCTIGITRDITISKKMQEELVRNKTNIDSLHNMIDKIKNYTAPYELLKNIGEELLNYLGADGISIFIYDEQNTTLFKAIQFGMAEKIFEDCEKVKISKALEEKLVKVKEGNGDYIENRYEKVFKNCNIQLENVNYKECYTITFNKELIGILTMSYKKDNEPKLKQDDFINSTCDELGVIIKNYMLSEALKKEFDKRLKTERELELFLETAVDIVCIIGADGYFKSVTFQCVKTLGWSQEELLSMDFRTLIHPDDVDGIVKVSGLSQLMGDVKRFINRYKCKNGGYRWLQVSSNVIPERNVAIATAIDITEERELEEEKKKLEKTVALESLKNELFTNVSHEFKTPLNIILTTTQLLLESKKNSCENFNDLDLNRYMKSIRQNSYRLLRLVNNFIDITKIDAGYYKLHLGNYNIVSVIEDITLSVAEYVENKGIELIFDTNVEEQIIACDPDKVERIMLNLLSNAIKYTDENGKIQVNFISKEDKIVVSVKDNGVGISKENLNIIFDRFKQDDNAFKKRCEGSGIGLSLVKSLVNMHGGDIFVLSEINNGAEFIFDIPIKLIEGEFIEKEDNNLLNSKIEKCNIEFSDIYS